MKNQLLNLKMIALMCLMMVLGGANVWADNVSYKLFGSKWNATCDGVSTNWTSIAEANNYNTDVQVTTKYSGACANSPISFENIKSVTIHYHTNKTKGVGTISIYGVEQTSSAAKSGTQIGSTFTVEKPSSGGDTSKSKTFSPSTSVSGYVQIYVTCTTNSVYIESVDIEYEPASSVKYDVTWNVNGEVYTKGEPSIKVSKGQKVSTLPTAPEAINGKVFVGWTSTEISGESASEPADLFSTVENAPVVSANTTYYAVYANKVGSEYWKKVIAANVNSEGEGEYALLTPDGHAFNAEIKSGNGQATNDAFTFVSNKAESAPKGTCILTLTKAGTKGYIMYNAEYGYLYAMDNKSGKLAWNTTENSYWSYSSSNWIYAECGAYLRCYNNSFRTYGSNNGDLLVFAKKVSDIAYSGYCTTVTAAAEPTYTKQTPVTFRAEDNGYYATFSNDKVTFITSDNSEAYKIVVSDGNIVKTKFDEVAADINGENVKGFYIPANTGVLLYSTAPTADYYTVANKTVDAISSADNMLMPAPKDGGVFAFNEGYKYYKLAYGNWTNKTQLGFYWGADNGAAFYVKAGTAYLAVSEANAAGAKGFAFNGEATGIEGVNANVENAKAIYNLNGQRVASMAKPGLYIVNGKKVVRK